MHVKKVALGFKAWCWPSGAVLFRPYELLRLDFKDCVLKDCSVYGRASEYVMKIVQVWKVRHEQKMLIDCVEQLANGILGGTCRARMQVLSANSDKHVN